MAESDRRPGESERDWMRRIAEQGRKAQQRKKDTDRQNSLDRQAEEAEIREAMGDEVWLHDAVKDLFGMSPDQLDAQLDKAQKSKDWDQRDAQILADLEAAKKKRLLESKQGRNRRVKKHLAKNKDKIEKAAKKGKGCAVIAVALLGAGGGVLYGLFEAGHALVSALGH